MCRYSTREPDIGQPASQSIPDPEPILGYSIAGVTINVPVVYMVRYVVVLRAYP
jgi:hypothetical protein